MISNIVQIAETSRITKGKIGGNITRSEQEIKDELKRLYDSPYYSNVKPQIIILEWVLEV